MGRRSVKENKNIYQLCREDAGLTREQAGERMEFVSSDRIEKIEYELSVPHPEEILAMAECYRHPELCNYYCSHECRIGREYVPEIKMKDLSRIVLEAIASLNTLNREKDRLIEIAADGEISPDEYADFSRIQEELDRVSMATDSMQLWLDRTIADGSINGDELEAAKQELRKDVR